MDLAPVAEGLQATARDELAALRQENADLKRERAWIPVTERLPEKSSDCLVFCIDESTNIGAFYDDFVDYDGTPLKATHWQPLPEPPK